MKSRDGAFKGVVPVVCEGMRLRRIPNKGNNEESFFQTIINHFGEPLGTIFDLRLFLYAVRDLSNITLGVGQGSGVGEGVVSLWRGRV